MFWDTVPLVHSRSFSEVVRYLKLTTKPRANIGGCQSALQPTPLDNIVELQVIQVLIWDSYACVSNFIPNIFPNFKFG